MFGIDGTEFLVIILVAAIVIGPKDMPEMLRAFARAVARLRALGQEFRGHFDEAVRRADMQETADNLRDIGNSVRELDPRRKLQEFYASLERETAEKHEQRRLNEEAEAAAAFKNADAEDLTQAARPLAARAGDFDFAGALNIDAAARSAVEGRPLFSLRTADKAAANAVESASETAFGIAHHPFSARLEQAQDLRCGGGKHD